MQHDDAFHSGFISIVGRTNVGKSTLLNRILKQKVAIMSDKPQTTRNKIVGVYHADHAQIVFLDTPGFHKPKYRLNEFMMKTALNTLEEIDAVLYLIEAERRTGPGDRYILDCLKTINTPVILGINKIDLVPQREELLPIIDSYSQAYNFADIVPISALADENIPVLLKALLSCIPEGPQYYPEDMVTDQPERFIAAELIREKVLYTTREEIPYAVAVVVEQMKPRADQDLVDLHATVYVERDSQKGILIGKSGAMLKRIGCLARQDIERIFGTKVFLTLWVKVKKNWRMDENGLRMLGYIKS
ncbi:GTPase Era [candidate division KSB3 bacterium]|uniref:GTPase Era n=1 Tax=candidate division KSB3 bacterium TaxID=2044937 RepID=A0A2G6E138_9BACT|nr:MAG: GTPase Era [candidate division KSB3 bacterium]PIE30319.1 MAG: GTPase Era [candidate division KSB3 bacterium]